MIERYRHNKSFPIERGGELPELEIAYSTYGKLNEQRDNVIWVCHALTANSEVDDWWPHTVEKGRFLDPEKWFVVCANILGSHYGTTGPLSVDPRTGEPYYDTFPKVTIRDMVNAHKILADKLGIDRIHALMGSSVGGFQAMEWAIMEPERINKLFLIATDTEVTPWVAGLNETQRMAIRADKSYGKKSVEAGKEGMATARAIGLLSYRGPSGYNLSQKNHEDMPDFSHRATTYQNYQGEKLCNRFNAYSYMAILDAFDSHCVGRGRKSREDALKEIKADTTCIGITTDILFPPERMKKIASEIAGAKYHEIESEFGHDGFLVEYEQLDRIIKSII